MTAALRPWDARVTCEHCIERGEVTCAECGMSGVPLWVEDLPRYALPHHTGTDGKRCRGSFTEVELTDGS